MVIYLESVKKITPPKIKNFLKKFRSETPNEERLPYLKYIHSLNLGPKDVALDLGANVGDITEIMASKNATVYAFEPNPFAFQVLSDRFFKFPNIHCINKGVSDRSGLFNLYLHEKCEEDQVMWSTGSSFLDFKENINKEKFVEVEVVDLVRFIEKITNTIKLIKMDVEGMEYRILDKLLDCPVYNKVENIIVETHDKKIPEIKKEADRVLRKIKEKGSLKIRMDWI